MSRSRSDLPAGWTAAPAFHPEFGLLCPYPRKRGGGLRAAVLVGLAVVAVSATIGLAAAHFRDGEGFGSGVEQMSIAGPAAQPSASAKPDAPSAKGDICTAGASDDPAASFLSSICGSSKVHARHRSHAANRVAGVVPDRSVPPEQAATPPMPATAPSESATGQAEKTSPSPEHTAAVKKPRAKPRAPRDLDRQNGMSAFASAPRGFAFPYGSRPMATPRGFDPPPW